MIAMFQKSFLKLKSLVCSDNNKSERKEVSQSPRYVGYPREDTRDLVNLERFRWSEMERQRLIRIDSRGR